VVERINSIDASGNAQDLLNKIHIALCDVNTHLISYAQQNGGDVCGCTVVGMVIRNHECMFFWAGDSRLYLSRNGQLSQLTKDHSVEQEKIDRGELAPDEDFAGKNMITRAIGGAELLELDMGYHQLQPGDQFLLCSDGVYNELAPQEIAEFINHDSSVKQRCIELNHFISQGTASDNFTGVIVSV
jgi:serine/threonine protein phosphatase PrpC